jgi:predicted transcriptional regulator
MNALNALERCKEMEGALQSLTGAWVRTRILFSLQDGPQATPDLTQAVEASITSVLHSTKAMIAEGTVERGPEGFSLTNTGRIKMALLAELINGLAALDECNGFWLSHDLSGIPSELKIRIGQLAGGTVIQDEPADPLKSQTAFIEAVAQAQEVQGVSPITAPGYQEMILAALERGAKVSLILTKSIISKIDPDALQAAFAYENFQLYEISDAKVAFTVTDKLVSIALFNLDGSYDPQQDLICEGPEAVRWGRELFEHYLEQALPEKKILVSCLQIESETCI